MRLTACACRPEHYRRVRRSGWMRLFSSRRLYHCMACEAMLFIPRKDAGGRPFEDTIPDERAAEEVARGHSAA